MKEKIIALTTILTLLLGTTPALAWMIDIDADVTNAGVLVLAGGVGDNYGLDTTAGILGTGDIDVDGDGDDDDGYLITSVHGCLAEGDLYAEQNLGVTDCCPECADCPPQYTYEASQSVEIDGAGKIWLAEGVDAVCNTNGQILYTTGGGDFKADMSSDLTMGGETDSHAMGASGENVWFKSFGIQGMDRDDCDNGGFFFTVMGYSDEPCDGDNCD